MVVNKRFKVFLLLILISFLFGVKPAHASVESYRLNKHYIEHKKRFFLKKHFKEFGVWEYDDLKREIKNTLTNVNNFKRTHDMSKEFVFTLGAMVQLKWCIEEIDSYFSHINARTITANILSGGVASLVTEVTGEKEMIKSNKAHLSSKKKELKSRLHDLQKKLGFKSISTKDKPLSTSERVLERMKRIRKGIVRTLPKINLEWGNNYDHTVRTDDVLAIEGMLLPPLSSKQKDRLKALSYSVIYPENHNKIDINNFFQSYSAFNLSLSPKLYSKL